MFKVKICGVTTPTDAKLVAEADADAIGLNFVSGSPRCLSVDAAKSVAAAVPRGIVRVGVFAGATAEEILRIAHAVGLDAIQLHGHLQPVQQVTAAKSPLIGDENALYDPPQLCFELAGLPVIRAVRLEAGDWGVARAWIKAAKTYGQAPAMVIVDASVSRQTAADQLGGTGATVDWRALARAGPLPLPMALAGGLTPENVAEAIAATGLRAVDTASGVESTPGHKDPKKLRAFVAAVREAISNLF
ncbi:MAG: phosphoribosylanthranilate isomerase [Planctomycetia bacterium]|nr:phosphoribosylanthranilate isomerase [Planctomycetia bacterium]